MGESCGAERRGREEAERKLVETRERGGERGRLALMMMKG